MRVRQYGRAALVIDEVSSAPEWAEGIRHANLLGITNVIAGQTTVVVSCVAARLPAVRHRLESVQPSPIAGSSSVFRIPVQYGGPGLDEAARLTGMSADSIIFRHASCTFRATFCASRPGRWFLDGLDPTLHVPAAPTASNEQFAGVSLLGAHCVLEPPGLQPRGTLIGQIDVKLWDLLRNPPSLLSQGASIRFEAAR